MHDYVSVHLHVLYSTLSLSNVSVLSYPVGVVRSSV